MATESHLPLVGGKYGHGEVDSSVETYRRSLLPSQFALVTHLIWTIVWWVTFEETDPSSCSGPLYNFGNTARWVLLGFFLWDLITVIAIRSSKARGMGSQIPLYYKTINLVYNVITIGFWAYSIWALVHREGCKHTPLSTATWVWVLIYAILPLMACCCLCFGVGIFGGCLAAIL